MAENIDLKKLWKKQDVAIIDAQDLIKKATQFKRSQLLKLILINFLVIATSIFIGLIWYYYQPEYLTTKIGIVLVIVAMLIYVVAYNFVARLLLPNTLDIDSKAYLNQLLHIREKQLFQQTTMLNIYFLLLSLGIGLYIIEYASMMTMIWAIVAYGLTILWFALNWFYLRPLIIKKQEAKLNEMIGEFRRLNDQLGSSKKG